LSQPLKVLIVDDEAPARNRLRELLADIATRLPVVVAGEAANGREALALVGAQPVDVILLDIRMPGMDGLETARHLLRLPTPPRVIFTTAYDSHAIQAFEVNAVDYLLKPVREERLLGALQKVRALSPAWLDALREAAPQARTSLSVVERGRITLVPVSDILYLKAEQKYVAVRTAEREYLVEESLGSLESEFGERFLRIHRSCLVARAAVLGFERTDVAGDESHAGWAVVLRGLAERLPVSRRQQHVIREFR
jgi:two-component system response regulator AlgR